MKLYFLGIGGTAMGNLAIMLQEQGHHVCGSDQKIYAPMRNLLLEHSIESFEGYSSLRLAQLNPDLVVIGNALSRGNEEVEWLVAEKKIPYCSFPELVRREVIAQRDSIVVSGTHGKTTTAALLAHLLAINHCLPGYLIGGVPLNFPSGANYGTPTSPFVIEGDEYDSAFFDKRSKFVHYAPKIFIINNIELDHIDIFRDIKDIQRAFSHGIKLVPGNGCIIANGDSEVIREILPVGWTQTIFVGKGNHNDFLIKEEKLTPQGATFKLIDRIHWEQWIIKSPLFGSHNVRNAALAIVAAQYYLNGRLRINLEHFKGVKKRQEVIYNENDLVIVEDFAHHPTAIKETILAVKQAFPDYKLITAFEPRSNTSCSSCFQETFIDAFHGSDELYIAEVFKKNSKVLDVNQLAQAIHYCAVKVIDAPTLKSFFSRKIRSEKQVFLFLSNGNFYDIAEHLKTTATLSLPSFKN
ncbi:MAG: Mur ligase domain-containing protein [Puniceicoccales bacterium]|jgi:UDP-N-acetylmuramate: L-alanyl-gamma-D-glutamyl-meso-diaminopimelate ligase|nr:Mur ligase domain-containing protein [Puniceicoccales bacterium]